MTGVTCYRDQSTMTYLDAVRALMTGVTCYRDQSTKPNGIDGAASFTG